MLKDTFIFQGPLGEIECVVEPNRSENNAVLVMAHGFRGSRDSGGRSLGGAASIITAAQDGALAGLILWATPNNLRFTFRYVMTEDEYRRLDSGETLHFNDERGECALTPDFLTDFDQYDLPALLQKAQPLPVLLLHCSADEVVLAEQAQRNAAAIGNAAELHIFEGGDHSFTEYSDEAGALLSDWLGKRLKCGAC